VQALTAHSRRNIRYHVKQPLFAVVLRLNPLQVEFTESRLVLDDDDLTIAQSVRKYDLDHGLKVGDTVLVQPVGDGDYVIVAVVSEKHAFEGSDTSPVLGAGTIGGGSGTAIVGTVPFRDASGAIIGRLPLLPP
jgi:hypothetical protein